MMVGLGFFGGRYFGEVLVRCDEFGRGIDV